MKHHKVLRYALALLLVGAVAALLYLSPSASGQNKYSEREELQKVLRDFDLIDIDQARAARQVRDTGRLSLVTSKGTFNLSLTPHDLRAPDYRAEAVSDGVVVRVLERAPSRTFKGKVIGGKDSVVRLTIDDGTLEGLIIVNGQKYFIEPASRYTAPAASAGGGSLVFYSESDVIKGSIGECGLTMAEEVGAEVERIGARSAIAAKSGGGVQEELFAPFHQVQIATEADFEYFQFFGSAAAANNEILSILNQVEGIYESQIGLTFEVTFQNVWQQSNDPYTLTNAGSAGQRGRLDEFRDHWNATRGGVVRDVAHMWTGIDFNGPTIGIAFQPGVDCEDLRIAYGMSQRLSPAPDKFLVAAHEIGHNFNASHTDSVAGCDNTIMGSSLGFDTQQNFCPFSRDQITTHAVDNSSCLTPQIQPGCSYGLSTSLQSFPTGGGSATVGVSTGAGCNWGVAEGASWITVTSGESGSGPGSFSFTAAANTGPPRSAKVNVAGQILTVTQAGSSNCPATPIGPGQTLSGQLSNTDCRAGLADRENAFIDLYTFGAHAGQQVRIEMNAAIRPQNPPVAGDLDTFLYLFGPDSSIVAENDDIVLISNTDSRIPVNGGLLTLPATGTYIIGATSFGENDTGAYTITLTGNVTPPPSGSFAFSSGTYAATEGASPSVTVTVIRGGDSSGAASVNFATSDGSAVAGFDYAATSGTLTFNAGETSKSFDVSIINDTDVEPSETFNLTLSNPTGGTTLGSPSAAVVTIASDDSSGGGRIGLYSQGDGVFFLRDALAGGPADVIFAYGPGGMGWVPLMGDWNGDGVDTVGLYDPNAGTFFLKNTNSQGVADVAFSYGPAGLGWRPLAGDWNGDGVDTVGLYDPAAGAFFLKNTHGGGAADVVFFYGPGGAGWVPLAGDWNGDGVDTAGLYDPAASAFFLKNANSQGVADVVFFYGPAGSGWVPLRR